MLILQYFTINREISTLHNFMSLEIHKQYSSTNKRARPIIEREDKE